MKVATIFGLIIFGALTMLFFRLTHNAYKKEKEGEVLSHPAIGGVFVTIMGFVMTLFCFLHMTGLWDIIVEWVRVGQFE